MPEVKRTQLAGSWYPADAQRLRQQVEELLRQHRGPSSGALQGLIVPHAGYVYSGRAAAAGYARLRAGEYGRVVILAPSHFAGFHGMALLEADGFETPLGVVAIDRTGVELLRDADLYESNAPAFQGEHALEIQLPFLQQVLPDASVVPVLVGELSLAEFPIAAAALHRLMDATTLFVVSSDFVHYGWRFGYLPFRASEAEQVRRDLRALDMGAITRVCAGDADGFQAYLAETGATICGAAPITLFLTMHGRGTPGELLIYYTSLDVTGDFEHCVSYASIAFARSA